MYCSDEDLKRLETKLISDLEAVRRVMARNADPDLIRVASMLGEIKSQSTPKAPREQIPKLPQKGQITREEIAQVVLSFSADFKFSDIIEAVEKEFPGRQLKTYLVPTVIRKLRETEKIKEATPRQGRNGATYARL